MTLQCLQCAGVKVTSLSKLSFIMNVLAGRHKENQLDDRIVVCSSSVAFRGWGHSPHRLVVRTSRCGRDNPGSTPGEDILFMCGCMLYVGGESPPALHLDAVIDSM